MTQAPLSALKKTLLLALGMNFVCGYVSFVVQSRASSQVSSCSYLDPISIDILAFIVALYLFFDGLVSIFLHKESRVSSQLPRCFRMCIGTSILVIHTLQFLHK